jgi:hypothetical protein
MLNQALILGKLAARRGPGETDQPAFAIVKRRFARGIAAFDEHVAPLHLCEPFFFPLDRKAGTA